MDPVDRKTVLALQKQGRITNVELARMNDLAPSSMLERVRRLEDKGIIKGYQAVVDPKALGFEVHALVMVNLDLHRAEAIDQFEQRIRSIPEVTACFHVTGRYDYLIHVMARDMEHLGEMIKHTLGRVGGVEKQETFIALSTIKEGNGDFLETIPEDGKR